MTPVTSDKLHGKLSIKWTKEDSFYYEPDPLDPLTYERANGKSIVPGIMPTDGGSVPRVFWSRKGYSPWAYGPAYILHDWMYQEHRCNPASTYTFKEANDVLYDAIGILVKEKQADGHHNARFLIRWAVQRFGGKAWREKCHPVVITAKTRRSPFYSFGESVNIETIKVGK